MANVYPFSLSSNIDSSSSSLSSSSSNNNYISSKKETLTVWMKSLVVQGNGCTAYNDKGEIVYRVDNYDKKNNDEVYLMDLQGKVLFTILRKKMWGFCRWEGYRSNSSLDSNVDDKPLFRVNKSSNFLGKESCYRLESSAGKSALRILDDHGRLVAEAKVKESSSGVVLGDDILNLVMEIGVDQSLVMALVTVYGLMRHKM